jgi:hypothetical protein
MCKVKSIFLAVCMLTSAPVLAITYPLGEINPTKSVVVDYNTSPFDLVNDFTFFIAGDNWAKFDFTGNPSSGGISDATFSLTGTGIAAPVIWTLAAGEANNSDYLRSYLYTGLTIGEIYTLNIALLPIVNENGVASGKYSLNVTGQDPTLSAVPLPAALPLFLSGLGVIGLLGRRRKH